MKGEADALPHPTRSRYLHRTAHKPDSTSGVEGYGSQRFDAVTAGASSGCDRIHGNGSGTCRDCGRVERLLARVRSEVEREDEMTTEQEAGDALGAWCGRVGPLSSAQQSPCRVVWIASAPASATTGASCGTRDDWLPLRHAHTVSSPFAWRSVGIC